jgi:hypothetical protein
MNTIEIAKKLAELCKQGRNMEALDVLFADDVVSVEAVAMPGAQQEVKGLAAVRESTSGGSQITRFIPPR